MQRRDFLNRLVALLAVPALSRFARDRDAASQMLDDYEATELMAARIAASYSATGLPTVHALLRSAGFEAVEIPIN